MNNDFIVSKRNLKKILNYSPNKTKSNGRYSNTPDDEARFIKELYVFPNGEENLVTHNDFLKNLQAQEDFGTFIIRGYAGTGKSAFVIYCCNKLRKNHEIVKIDLPFVTKDIVDLLRIDWKNPDYKNTLSLLLNGVLKQINSVLLNEKNNYKKWYNYYTATKDKNYIELFNIINSNLNDDTKEDELRKIICNRLDSKLIMSDNKKMNDEKYIGEIKYFLLFLMLLKISSLDEKKLCFFFIDGIEEFIQSIQVFNNEIQMIRKMLHNFRIECMNKFEQWGKSNDRNRVKFVLAYRDTTEKMMKSLDSSDSVDDISICDVSMWYSSNRILEKRLDVFSQEISHNDLEVVTKTIFKKDDESGVLERISDLYSQNKRRTFHYTVDILTEDLCKSYLTINKLASVIRKKLSFNEPHPRPLEVLWRFDREVVIRAIWENIKTTSYFENLDLLNTKGTMYMRRILIYLNNTTSIDEKRDIYVSFKSLIEDCFLKNDNEIPSLELCEDLAKILYYMNLWSREHHNWSQLVSIKFNDRSLESISERKVKTELGQKIYSLCKEDDDAYGVKITLTGRSFLRYITSYEYFSCRYSNLHLYQSRPLDPNKSLIQVISNTIEINNEGKLKKAVLNSETTTMINESLKSTARETLGRFSDNGEFLNKDGCLPNVFIHSCRFFDNNYSKMFSNSDFLYITKNNNKITHIEYVIDNHVSYLSYLRIYVLLIAQSIQSDLPQVNCDPYYALASNILKIIKEYISAYKYFYEKKDGDGLYYFTGKRYPSTKARYEHYYGLAYTRPREMVFIDKIDPSPDKHKGI
jgi:hypothetical protein